MKYLVAVAITTILADAFILEKLKNKITTLTKSKPDSVISYGLHCYMCIGFWVGLAYGRSLEFAVVVSFLSYVTGLIIDRLSRHV